MFHYLTILVAPEYFNRVQCRTLITTKSDDSVDIEILFTYVNFLFTKSAIEILYLISMNVKNLVLGTIHYFRQS